MTEKVDYLDVDPPLTGQNWTCLSFVSPEKILVKKEVWLFNEFLKEFCEKEKYDYTELKGKYDDFMYVKQERLEKEFHKENENQTTVRGVKVSGCFDTRKEAEVRSEVLRRLNSNHHIFIGQVGYWLPWDPNADSIDDQKFQEESLNNLVGKHKENQEQRDMFYEERKRENIKQLEEDNRRKKEVIQREKEKIDEENKVKEEKRKEQLRLKQEAEEAEKKNTENESDATKDSDATEVGDTVHESETKVGEDANKEGEGENKSYLQFEDEDPWMKRHKEK